MTAGNRPAIYAGVIGGSSGLQNHGQGPAGSTPAPRANKHTPRRKLLNSLDEPGRIFFARFGKVKIYYYETIWNANPDTILLGWASLLSFVQEILPQLIAMFYDLVDCKERTAGYQI